MLLAVLDPRGSAAERLKPAVSRFGPPGIRLGGDDTVLAGWHTGAIIHRDESGLLEGHCITPWSAQGAAFASHGEELTRVTGDFARLEAVRGSLFLMSGRAGGYRPIYVGTRGDSVVAASTSMEMLLAVLGARPPPNVDFFAWQLLVSHGAGFAADASPYQGIACVPMNEAWLVRPGHPPSVRLTARAAPIAEPTAEPDDLAQLLRDALRQAVMRACASAPKVGVMVGGGVDSSGVLAITCALASSSSSAPIVEALSLDFATSYGDDRPYMRALTAHLGLEPHRIAPREAAAAIGRFTYDAMPSCHPAAALSYPLFTKAKALGAPLLLTGVGGDGILDGDPKALSELLLRGDLSALRRAASLRATERQLREYILRPLMAWFEPSRLRTFRRTRAGRQISWAGPRLKAYLASHVRHVKTRPILTSGPADRYEQIVAMPFVNFRSRLRGQEDTAHGVTQRDPLLDDEFLRVVSTIPPIALLHGNFLRGLFRESLRGLVPEPVRLRETKASFQPAFAQMVDAAGGYARFVPLIGLEKLGDLGLVEPRAFRAMFDDLRRGDLRRGFHPVWPALALESFLREYDGASARSS